MASYETGVLILRIPFAESAKPRKVHITERAAERTIEAQTTRADTLDLVGSTALAQRLSTRELGGSHRIRAGRGRHRDRRRRPVVKLIGDEVLYTASDAAAACTIALNLIQAEPLGKHQLKGFDDDVEFCRLLAP